MERRDLAQIRRDLKGNLQYVSKQTAEALGFVELLEKEFSGRVGRRLLARLRRLDIDEDIMEMMLIVTKEEEEELDNA